MKVDNNAQNLPNIQSEIGRFVQKCILKNEKMCDIIKTQRGDTNVQLIKVHMYQNRE